MCRPGAASRWQRVRRTARRRRRRRRTQRRGAPTRRAGRPGSGAACAYRRRRRPARTEVVGEHLGALVRARDEQTSRVAGHAAADCPRFEGSLTSMGALEARCTIPPSTGSGTSACGSTFRAAMPLAIPSSCALEMTARRAAGMARSPARPGIVNMKTAVTQVTPSFCTVHGAWVPVRGAAA